MNHVLDSQRSSYSLLCGRGRNGHNWRVLVSVIFVLALAAACTPGTFTYPEPNIETELEPDLISASEYATIKVFIYGQNTVQSNPVSVSVVIALDESGSMGPYYQDSRAAAISFIQLLKGSPNSRVGVIAIKDSPEIVAEMTSDKDAAISKIQSLGGPGGGTDIKSAFDLTNQILGIESAAIRMAIMLTDGQQLGLSTHIDQNLKNATDHNIQYFTIGFRSFIDTKVLSTLAQTTGGHYKHSGTSTAQLTAFYKEIWAFNENALHVRDLIIKDVLNPEIELIKGSFSSSFPQSADLSSAVSAFESSVPHILELPEIWAMPSTTTHTYNFQITVRSCLDQERELDLRDLTKSSATFTSNAGGGPFSRKFDQETLRIRKCGLPVNKSFVDGMSTVNIEVRNGFDVPVREVVVQEVPSRFFKAVLNTASPSGAPVIIGTGLKGVSWSYPTSLVPGTSAMFTVQVWPTCDALDVSPPPLAVNTQPTTAILSYISYEREKLVGELSADAPSYDIVRNALVQSDAGPVKDFLDDRGLVHHVGPTHWEIQSFSPSEGYPADVKWTLVLTALPGGSLRQRFLFADRPGGLSVYETVEEQTNLGRLDTLSTYDLSYWLTQAGTECP